MNTLASCVQLRGSAEDTIDKAQADNDTHQRPDVGTQNEEFQRISCSRASTLTLHSGRTQPHLPSLQDTAMGQWNRPLTLNLNSGHHHHYHHLHYPGDPV